jgi:hypothetical protein
VLCALCAFRTRQVTQKDGDYGFVARKLRVGLAEITARYFLAENADFKSPAEIKEIKEIMLRIVCYSMNAVVKDIISIEIY